MDNNLVRWAILIVLLAHGVGHVMGFLAAWTNVPMGFTDRPWVLSSTVTLESAVGRAFGLLWLVALVAFLGGVYGLIGHQDWARTLLIAAAFISLVAILPWWNTVTAGSRLGAVLVDVVVIAALLPPWGVQIVQSLSQ
ncbi:MAG: hypothetical protein K8J31_06580 [Anaerolineae bacterium]|nr:hypothetical protein [Anaerolineae bacterium]